MSTESPALSTTSSTPSVPDGARAVLGVGPLLSCPLEGYSLRLTHESGQTPRNGNGGRKRAAARWWGACADPAAPLTPRPSLLSPLLLSPRLCSQSHPLPASTARNPSPVFRVDLSLSTCLSGPPRMNTSGCLWTHTSSGPYLCVSLMWLSSCSSVRAHSYLGGTIVFLCVDRSIERERVCGCD